MTTYYPGSKMRPRSYDHAELPISEETVVTLSNPREYSINGLVVELYNVGTLAQELNRKPVTIRKWEADGIIPKPVYSKRGHEGDKRGRRRLYTGDQILGLKKIAEEEGILEPGANGKWKAVLETDFRARAIELFKRLSESK